MRSLIISLIKWYQYWVSPLLGPCCRFTPTCSEYAIDAFRTYGFFRAAYLSIRRLSCCHPFHRGGYDPIPKRKY